MKLYQILLLLVIFVSGCTQGFQIEENKQIITENALVQEKLEDVESSLNTINENIDGVKESAQVAAEELQEKIETLDLEEKISNVQDEEIAVEEDIILYVTKKDDFFVLEWEDSLSNVKWYKIMHSTSNSDLKYPEDNALAVHESYWVKRFEHWEPKRGINYYRISAVLEDDSVVHSEVSIVEI